jgi:hypothetical protein
MGKSKRSGTRKRRGGSPSRKKGVLTGMRSGFKNVAHSVVGAETESKKKSSLASTLLTILLVVAAAALLYRRFF